MPNNQDSVLIKKITLKHPLFQANALIFLPATSKIKLNHVAIFSHGYTSSKNDLINWATRLADHGITTAIFDLPGHYMGSFHEINSLSDFKNHAHELFAFALSATIEFLKENSLALDQNYKLYLGGHSLGALIALKAHDQPNLPKDRIFICVGLGINSDVKVHLFDTDFYKKTLNIRKQLVSPHLDPKDVFPWVKDHKYNLDIQNEHVVLICGADDAVVGQGGAAALEKMLAVKNKVELIEPVKLPHHDPELAASSIYHFIKQFL